MKQDMIYISKSEFSKIGDDYKGIFSDFQRTHPKWKGRRTAFLPGHGTTLFIEGIHFIVDGDCSHLPALNKENAEEGAAYQFAGGFVYVKRLYKISKEYAKEHNLLYLDRVETSVGDFALPGGDLSNESLV
ncbi:hypothetical protein [Flavonifractor sp. An4]|uniref:hypothetical protein n=1 Tax=Flavonifractor sp. An4 TaxID=1965634 RepID=UPI000B3892E2|nr:hypothetical protein [Flavonifractor sp. An4]OUO12640.1 hypothetical protein B5F94_11625 [Flavonifractor sp. An4]